MGLIKSIIYDRDKKSKIVKKQMLALVYNLCLNEQKVHDDLTFAIYDYKFNDNIAIQFTCPNSKNVKEIVICNNMYNLQQTINNTFAEARKFFKLGDLQ